MYYTLTVDILYSREVAKKIQKNKLPKEIWIDFKDAFEAFAQNRNFRLFDMKKMVNKGPHVYYRLRIRNYRALFHMDNETIYVEDIAPRGEVYK